MVDARGNGFAQYGKRGFVASFGAWYSYINAVGVAFRPTDGSQLVALTCGGIVDILPREKCLKQVGPALVELVQRMRAIGGPKPVIGVSGGLDSTHALLVVARAMDVMGRPRSDILAYTSDSESSG